ncbi:MAG TPA: endolytic transglycosylase MltG, partial [Caldisericia bacterium]|nr:endolytic transglycosylase MltG [Caldisericia bacterium]
MKYIKICIIIFIIVLLSFLSLGFYAYFESQPPSVFESKKVYIKENLTAEEIAEKLKSENIIKNKIIFSLLAKYLDIDENLKSGIYEFNEKIMSKMFLSNLQKE